MSNLRSVFYVSDGTGITAETIGHTLLTQFANSRFHTDRIPFVDGPGRAQEVANRIRADGEATGIRPIIISSCVDPDINALLADSGALLLDVFAPFIQPLEHELGQARQRHVGKAHGMVDFERYHQRINAINFALSHDDGMSINYNHADVILVAISRAGKTPTCIYLAMHHGVRAANYPLTEEDLEHDQIPPHLRAHRAKLFGLSIDPVRLQQIRQERRPGSRYADLQTCKHEVSAAERLFRAERIPMLTTTCTSIEEIASKVMATLNIQRHMY